MTLGQKIKELRSAKGLTQKELADQLHVTFQTISKWENDENEPDIATLKLLTKIFDCSLDELLDNEKETESNIEEQPSIQNPKRKTYVSDNPLNVNSLAFCTSFELVSGIYTYSDRMVANSSAEYKKEISEKQYSFTRKMMKDVLADFFIDDTNKTFGFYYEHAEQFVCPFENVLDINIEEGNYICGIERVKSFLIKISYCSEDVVDTYSVLLFAYTQASKEKWRLVNDSLLFQESDSQTWVNNTLSVIKDKISSIRQIGNDIKANKIQVNPFDIDEKNAAAKEGQWIMNVAHRSITISLY